MPLTPLRMGFLPPLCMERKPRLQFLPLLGKGFLPPLGKERMGLRLPLHTQQGSSQRQP